MSSKLCFAIMLLVALSSCMLRIRGSNGYVDLTVSEAKNMTDSNPSLVVLDVRNQSEYNSGHIKNAKLIPVWELDTRISELDQNRETLVYCSSGVRSAAASQILTEHGFNKVYNMLSGIMAWKAIDYPVYVRYSSLQEAIDAAEPGKTLYTSSGIYLENIVLDKPLALVGENKSTTIIDGNGTLTTVQINASNTSITNFTIQGSGCGCDGRAGILVESSYNSSIMGNIIKNNGGYGIFLWYSNGCVVTNNDITNNTNDGIYLHYSNSSTISGNNIINNYNQAGIKLVYTNGCTFTCNTLLDNTCGTYLLRANSNKFYHNNFINNTRQVSPMDDFGNIWDNGYPSGGNYWSNYNGTDIYNGQYQDETGSDGIGDSAFQISPLTTPPELRQIDRYPLMGTFSRFHVAWAEQNYYVDVISNSTISDFEFGLIHDSELAHSAKQVSIEFLYWDPSKDPNYCPSCKQWVIVYEYFLGQNNTVNTIQQNYSSQVLINWIEYYSHDGQVKSQLYNATAPNSLVIIGEDGNFTLVEGYFSEAYLREVIDAYLAMEPQAGISFTVTGSDGWVGFCRVVVPRALIEEPYAVLVNGTAVDTLFIDVSNSTYSYVYFTYRLCTKQVVITPEFPSALVLPLFIIVTLTMAIVMKQRRPRRKEIPTVALT